MLRKTRVFYDTTAHYVSIFEPQGCASARPCTLPGCRCPCLKATFRYSHTITGHFLLAHCRSFITRRVTHLGFTPSRSEVLRIYIIKRRHMALASGSRPTSRQVSLSHIRRPLPPPSFGCHPFLLLTQLIDTRETIRPPNTALKCKFYIGVNSTYQSIIILFFKSTSPKFITK